MKTLKKLKNEAVGAFEAAGVMGVHFTRPRRMAEAGVLASRQIGATGGPAFSVYSARECDENYLDYEENYESRKRSGEHVGRPRTAIHERQQAVERILSPDKPQIAFEDAIGVPEAAEILGVFPTRVLRAAREGKIVGRVLWSERGNASRLWILSRMSVESHAAEVKKLEASGLKKGRPRGARQPSAKKRKSKK